MVADPYGVRRLIVGGPNMCLVTWFAGAGAA